MVRQNCINHFSTPAADQPPAKIESAERQNARACVTRVAIFTILFPSGAQIVTTRCARTSRLFHVTPLELIMARTGANIRYGHHREKRGREALSAVAGYDAPGDRIPRDFRAPG